MQQIEMISLEELIPETHSYRRFIDIWSFKYAEKQLKKIETTNPHKGFGLLRLSKCLLLQFLANLSDRELERCLQENNAAKWFCQFNLREETPDHSVFSRARQKIGSKMFI